MKITLTDAGKRFNRDWIFKNLSYTFSPGISYAITGPNGSGKSTLLQLIAGSTGPSQGKVLYEQPASRENAQPESIAADEAFRYLAFAAPYLDVIEEMTLLEFLEFHSVFKPFLKGLKPKDIVENLGLQSAAGRQIRYYSSGMKQRVKLAQAIFSDTSALLLDEPCSNLDTQGIELYQQMIKDFAGNRLVIVSSNDVQEYAFCTETLNLMQFKK